MWQLACLVSPGHGQIVGPKQRCLIWYYSVLIALSCFVLWAGLLRVPKDEILIRVLFSSDYLVSSGFFTVHRDS